MIAVKINASKIDKAHLFKGEKGTYLDLALMENKDGPDQYGNDGFVVQSIGKEARERGERGPIIGNWRKLAAKGTKVAPAKAPAETTTEADDVPF